MNWYAKKSFTEYFNLIDEFEDNTIIAKEIHDYSQNYDYSDSHILDFINKLEECYINCRKTEFLKAATEYPTVRRIFGTRGDLPEWYKTRIMENFTACLAGMQGPERIKYVIRWKSLVGRYTPDSTYMHKVIQEFFGYLYKDRKQENEEKIAFKEKLNEYVILHKQITEMADRIDEDLPVNFFSNGPRRDIIRLEKYITHIEIKKNSNTLQERVFVENMLRLNKRYYRQPYLNIIQELMCLPFFHRQLDPSTLSRIWRNMQVQKKEN